MCAKNTAGNVYYVARIRATRFNAEFESRSATIGKVGIGYTTLAKIERGQRVPLPEEVVNMANAYHAPELIRYYCEHSCPLHQYFSQQRKENHLDEE